MLNPPLLLPTLSLRPNSFVIITANRVLHCNADAPEEMHHWITLLQRCKGDARVEGQEFIVRGACRPAAVLSCLDSCGKILKINVCCSWLFSSKSAAFV